ncbi:MAG TPA: hypothetical protein VIL30_17590 [Ramlibacter sp.]|jgi:hypothetical protein
MTPRQLAVEVENAYDNRSRDSLVRFLGRLTAAAESAQLTLAAVTGRNLGALTLEQLASRRNELHVQLAAVNDQVLRMNGAGRRSRGALNDDWLRDRSLDPSEPESPPWQGTPP